MPVSVGEKERGFVPVGIRTDVTKGEREEKATKEKVADSKTEETKGRPAESTPAEPTRGTVNVSSNPTGGDVLVDGEFVGNCPAALKLAPGKHTVTVKMSGYKDWSREITVQSGSEVQLTASLEK